MNKKFGAEQGSLKEYYLQYKWDSKNLDKINGWLFNVMKFDILLAIMVQCQLRKISGMQAMLILGTPDWLWGTISDGLFIYMLKSRKDIEPSGRYVAVLFVKKGVIVSGGTNRIDSFSRTTSIKRNNYNKLKVAASQLQKAKAI